MAEKLCQLKKKGGSGGAIGGDIGVGQYAYQTINNRKGFSTYTNQINIPNSVCGVAFINISDKTSVTFSSALPQNVTVYCFNTDGTELYQQQAGNATINISDYDYMLLGAGYQVTATFS